MIQGSRTDEHDPMKADAIETAASIASLTTHMELAAKDRAEFRTSVERSIDALTMEFRSDIKGLVSKMDSLAGSVLAHDQRQSEQSVLVRQDIREFRAEFITHTEEDRESFSTVDARAKEFKAALDRVAQNQREMAPVQFAVGVGRFVIRNIKVIGPAIVIAYVLITGGTAAVLHYMGAK